MNWINENRGSPKRVVVTKDLPGTRWREALTAAGCEICISTSKEQHTIDEILDAIGDRCDGAIGQLTEAWGADLFEALARAGGRVYSNYAVGYDNVDVPEASDRGIAVGNTPGVLTETTAELAIALTLAAARRIPESESYLREDRFRGWLPDLFLGKRLCGGTVGVIGCGRIGSRYARAMALGFDMDVLYRDLSARDDLEGYFESISLLSSRRGERPVTFRRATTLEELLESSDVVSVHVPLDKTTRHLLSRVELERMKNDAILVNTSRGPIIDELALVDHLQSHPEFRVGLDVFEHEPLLTPGLVDLPNAVIVPHIGSATVWTREGMATLAACNVAGVLQGFPVASRLEAGDFLTGEFPPRTPSIVNREELSLATS